MVSDRIVCVDPGINGSGWATFKRGNDLDEARYVPNPQVTREVRPRSQRIHDMISALAVRGCFAHFELVTECPQIYTYGKGKGDPNQLIPLAQIGAGLFEHFYSADTAEVCWREYLPHEWKGSLDGDVLITRIRSRLSREEFSRIDFPAHTCVSCKTFESWDVVCSKSTCLAHNVFDAIGLGLHHLGRLDRHRVIAR